MGLTSASLSAMRLAQQKRHHDNLSAAHRAILGMVIHPEIQPRQQQDLHQDIRHLTGLLPVHMITGLHLALMTMGLHLVLRIMDHLLDMPSMGLRIMTMVLRRAMVTMGLLQGMGPHHWTTARHLDMVHQSMGHHHMAMGLHRPAMDRHCQVMGHHHQHMVIRHQVTHLHTIRIQGIRPCLHCQHRQDSAPHLQDMAHCRQQVVITHPQVL